METLADLVVKLRAQFDDSGFKSFNTSLGDTADQSQGAGDALKDLGQTVDSLIQNMLDGKTSAEDFEKAVYKLADDATAAGMKREVETLDELMSAFTLSGKSAEEFFGALAAGSKTPVVPPDALPEMMELGQAYARLGVTSSEVLREQAAQAKTAYDSIVASGKASAQDIQKAWIAMEEARQNAAIASGQIIAKAERDLLAQSKAPIEELKQEVVSLEQNLQNFATSLSSAGKVFSEVFTVPLAAASAALIKVGTDFDEVSDTIRARTGLVGEDLAKMNASFDSIAANVPNKLGDITTAMVALHDRLGLMGPQLEALSTQMLNLARITGEQVGPLADEASKAFARWKISTEDQAGALDKVYFASTQTGTAVGTILGTLTRFAPALQEVGFSFDQSVAMISKFEQAGLNMQRDITALQQSLLKLGKAGVKDPVEGLELLIDRIQKAGSVGEANAIGLKVFGRGAVDLVDAIRSGKLNLDDFVGSIQKSSGAVNKAAADTLSFSDKLKQLANQIEVALRPAGEAFLKILEQLLVDVKPLIAELGSLAKTFADLDPAFQKAIIGAGALLAAIGPTTFALATFMGQVSKLIPLLGSAAATEGLAGAEAAAATGATTFAGAIAGITFVSLAAGIVATIGNLNDLHEKWNQVADDMRKKSIFEAINAGKTIEDLKKLGFTAKEIADAYQGLGKQIDYSKLTLDNFGNVVLDTSKKGTEAAQKYDDLGLKIKGLGESTKTTTTAQDQHTAAMGRGKQSAAELNKAIDDLINGHKKLKTPLDDITKELQKIAEAEKHAYDAAAVWRQMVSDFGKDSPQAAVALGILERALKAIGKSTIEDLEPALMDASKEIEILGGHLHDVDPATLHFGTSISVTKAKVDEFGNSVGGAGDKVQSLIDKSGKWASLADQLAAGFTTISGHVTDTGDRVSTLNKYVDDFGTVISSAFGNIGVAAAQSLSEAIAQLDAQFQDFAASVGSFAPQLGIGGGGGTVKPGRASGGGFSFSGTPAEIIAELNAALDTKGTSRPTGDAQRALEGILNALAMQAIADYMIKNPGYDWNGNPPASRSSRASAPSSSTASAPTGSDVTVGLPGPAAPWDQRNAQGFFPTPSLEIPVPPEIPELTNTIANLNETLASASTTLVGALQDLLPAIQSGTDKIAASVQTQAAVMAGIANLPNSPAAASYGTASVFTQRLSTNNQAVSLQINVSNADEAQVAQTIVEELQRRGIRF